MSRLLADRPIAVRAQEEAAIARLVERLVERFPELPEEEIVRAVHGHYADYEDSSVRDFVPVLVERGAQRDLVRGVPRHRA
jgi:hypothetical protein